MNIDVGRRETCLSDNVRRECGGQVEDAVVHIRIAAVVRVPLELPVTAAAQSVLVLPLLVVQRVEGVLENQSTRTDRARGSSTARNRRLADGALGRGALKEDHHQKTGQDQFHFIIWTRIEVKFTTDAIDWRLYSIWRI